MSDGRLLPPYDFATFQARAALREQARLRTRQRQRAVLGVVGTVAVVAMVFASRPRPLPEGAAPGVASVMTIHPPEAAEPVVVNVAAQAAQLAIEDRIALMDQAINQARINGATDVVLPLRRDRELLLRNLDSIHYAQAALAAAR
ncbi:MAG: hypothetical protein R3E77_05080 [Steroidobacteraceae bacterium]